MTNTEALIEKLRRDLFSEASRKQDVAEAEIVLEAKKAEIAIAARADGQKHTEAQIQEIVQNSEIIYKMKLQFARYQYQYDLAKIEAMLQWKLLEHCLKAEEPHRTSFEDLFS